MTITEAAPTGWGSQVTINNGVLAYGSNGVIGNVPLIMNGGTLNLGTKTDTITSLTIAGGAVTGGTLSTNSGGTVTGSASISSVLSGNGGLTMNVPAH